MLHLRIGIPECSKIGFFGIAGVPTILDNTLRILIENQAIPYHAPVEIAVQYAQSMQAHLYSQKQLSAGMMRSFEKLHEGVCQEVTEDVTPLQNVYDAFTGDPSLAGMARYFGLLEHYLSKAIANRKKTHLGV